MSSLVVDEFTGEIMPPETFEQYVELGMEPTTGRDIACYVRTGRTCLLDWWQYHLELEENLF